MPKPFDSYAVTGAQAAEHASQAAPDASASATRALDTADARGRGANGTVEQDEESLLRHLRSRYDPAAMRLLKKLRKGPQA